ncbi:chromate efflux transporter [Xinfangfangia sp. D13-10-4-6]|uniref:chromate efflux transporter n=1 Tax=Pseudogemmobacter hezensis TaxID=2737662 RepID=UPI0015519824|nr:chromate efflux transporter [Pseudogemmobacter hezensis]NPD15136.1 chromate efflux transporter [Pseudogemmobacter hezensis]
MRADQGFPTLRESTLVWARIALLSFGGPAGQIAVMHRILVEERKWLGDGRFLHALNFCMLLPGPEAQQLATYIGWLMHGVRGALIAGGLFILPGLLAIMGLSWIYAIWGEVGFVAALFFGLKAAVLAIVLQAVVRVGKRALKNNVMRGIAVVSFVAIFAFGAPFPLLVGLAALVGWAGARLGLPAFASKGGHGQLGHSHIEDAETLLGEEAVLPNSARRDAFRAGFAALGLWLAPVAALLLFAPESVFTDIATYFSKLAVLTFGGAYAVLAWVAQEAVGTYGWLKPGEMLDGLGMAETTPGPLIMVLQFVGFMGAMREAGWAASLLAGSLGGLLATWVTFAPCFAWILLGAPFMEKLRQNQALSTALSAITAAVVGVILNLAIWFAIHVIWREVARVDLRPLSLELPVLGSIDWMAAGLSIVCLGAVFCLNVSMVKVLAGAALAGLAFHLVGMA